MDKDILFDLPESMNTGIQLMKAVLSIKNMHESITQFNKAMSIAARILSEFEVDNSDTSRYSYLLESFIYHMSRQIDENIQKSKEEGTISGMGESLNNEDKLFDNVQKLELGQEIKNYKELCKLLEQSEVGGKSKQYQLKDFQRYFEYQKVGQRFVITDIYDEPLPKDDKRRNGNNNIYVKYIEVILLRYLSTQKNFTCTLKKNQIWSLLGMINPKYNKAEYKKLEELDYIITPFEINHFYQRCNQRLERILFTSLNNLKNRCLLSYEEQLIIVDSENNYYKASDNDIRRIDAVKKSVLDSMNLISIIQVYCKFKSREFFDRVNELLLELYGWKYTYKQYKLIYTPEIIMEEIPKSEIELHKLTLNEKVIENINNNAETLYANQQEKWNKAYQLALEDYSKNGFGEWSGNISDDDVKDSNGNKMWKYPPCYLEAQRRLADELLRIGKHKKDEYLSSQEQFDKELDELFACLKN